ncbi:MAG: DUF2938 domain-containing protein [Archangium sp.]|nr:DUF2938 domain-containing protein [Archangium sp.]
MNDKTEFVVRAALIGAGATAVMDVWGVAQRAMGIKTLDFALLGRWVGHVPRGQWFHTSIARATPVSGELMIGWATHYAIGVTFAALLLAVYGLEWAHQPTLLPALAIGLVTAVAPLLILQPALGAGIFSSNTPAPLFNTLKSIATHAIFGLGLYASARVAALVGNAS